MHRFFFERTEDYFLRAIAQCSGTIMYLHMAGFAYYKRVGDREVKHLENQSIRAGEVVTIKTLQRSYPEDHTFYIEVKADEMYNE